ncbi:MAG: NlpC/P60 family protein [Elusimicrobiales bacterium]|nr:NlpC/P60 family protein [Elusimicrobiales bacterium]
MTVKTETQAQPGPLPRSWTVVHFLPGDFTGASLKNLVPAAFPEAAFRTEDSSRPAQLTSAELEALFPFDNLLLSADALFPGGGALQAEAQVKTAAGWSPWFSFGSFTPGQGRASAPGQDNAFGRMDVDILRLKAKAGALRYRITLTAGTKPPALRLAAVSYTDSTAPYDPALAKNPPGLKPLKVQVPRFSQMALQVNHSGDICSPVSMAMAFSALGLKADPLEAAAAVLDPAENIYGNWFFNTAHAGSRGLYSVLTRLNSLEDARAFLAAGAAVVASVTFGPDELRNSPLKKTKGHLLVITGFDARGNVITNDPAAPDDATVERVYDRAEFAAAWLKNKYGLAYILARDLNKFLAVRTAMAEFYSMPPADAAERGRLIESQLLANERVELLEVSGSWARARALEQPSLAADGRTLAPYEGWLPLDALSFSLPLPPTAVVRSKTVSAGGTDVSMGVKVRVLGQAKAGPRVLLGGGIPAVLQARHLTPLPQTDKPDTLRARILETARVFLGDKYYWGGRSAWGIDCSGLVNLAYRAWGLDLPRNAGDQYKASRRVSREDLKPADLIFSADAAKPGLITHVMLYAGGGRLIEATGDTNSVREVPFKEKFGADLSKIKHGALVNGKKVFFGRILK